MSSRRRNRSILRRRPFSRSRAGALFRLILVASTLAPGASAQDVPITALSLEELLEVRVRIGTGTPQTLSRVPAVVSVFTAEDIAAMGATELSEVLEAVPGLHVSPIVSRALDPAFTLRGLNLEGTQLLLLVDGIPVPQLLVGGAPTGMRIPATTIERVEVVRGPGSAVYGADAFAGVVNVVMRDDVPNGVRAGIRVGSFGFRDAWIEVGHSEGDHRWSAHVDARKTDGDGGRVVDRDLQTILDAGSGTSASRAPGPLRTDAEQVDVRLAYSGRHRDVRFWWAKRELGAGVGGTPALDPSSVFDTRQFRFDVVDTRSVREEWELTQTVSWFRLDGGPRHRLFPPGAVLPIGDDGNVDFVDPVATVEFPDGLIGRPGVQQDVLRLESAAEFGGWQGHRLRMAAGLVRREVDTREVKNFGPGVLDPFEPNVTPSLVDVSDSPFVYVRDHRQDHAFLSVQDQWRIADAWELTAGLRWDDYSDYGDTVNPRLALVWTARPEATAKLLYGRAFRGPSFGQQFGINSPQLGNPDLEPETLDMLELVVDVRPRPGLRTVVSAFRYRADDLIAQVPVPGQGGLTRTQNDRDQDGHGAELELTWEPNPRWRLDGSAAWVDSSRTGEDDPRDFPDLQASLALRWRVWDVWSVRGSIAWISDRPRAPGDPRPSVDDATTVDLVVRREGLAGRFDLAVVVKNALDEDRREPAPLELPGDIPLEGRSVRLDLSVRF